MKYLILILVAGWLITIGLYQTQNHALQQKNEKLTEAVKTNTNIIEEEAKKDTKNFLKAFFVYDTSKGQAGWSQIQPYTTKNGLKMLTPPGIDPNQKPEKTDPDKSVQSGIDKMLLYYTSTGKNKANIFARVWQKMTVNNVSSVTQLLLDIQLVFDKQQNKWMVDKMTIQQPLKPGGYVN